MWVYLTLCLLTLQFDGSLRPPRDPGFPTHGLGRMASCASAIFSHGCKLTALGGKLISIDPGLTSADTEYDGLLLGLKWLCRQPPEWWSRQDRELRVQGDCKAIIAQWNEVAVPRKLRAKYQEARVLLGLIDQYLDRISFEHIPRAQNTLTDAVCASAMTMVEQGVLAQFHKELALCDSIERFVNGMTSRTAIVVSRFLGETSLIRYSIRPLLYEEAVAVAVRHGDGEALSSIGIHIQRDSMYWPRSRTISQSGVSFQDWMMVRAIHLQMRGFELQNRRKHRDQLQSRHRYRMEQLFDCAGLPLTSFELGYHPDKLANNKSIANVEEDIVNNWCCQSGHLCVGKGESWVDGSLLL